MRIKDGFKLVRKDGQNVIVAEDANALNAAIVLNETASYLWELASKRDVSKEEMLFSLLQNYDISTVLALNDIDVFVRTLKEHGIIEQ